MLEIQKIRLHTMIVDVKRDSGGSYAMKMKIFTASSLFAFAIMICHYCGILLLPRWVLFALPLVLFLITTVMGLLFEHDSETKSKKISVLEKKISVLNKEKAALNKEIAQLKTERAQSYELQKKTARRLEVVTNTKNYYRQKFEDSNTGT